MIDFHCVSSANNFKIAIMLEETGLEYRVIKYEMLTGAHLTPEFRKINPNSKTLAIVDHAPADGGAALPIFESGAILLYLSEKTGMLMPKSFRRRALTQQWLVWQVAGMGPMHGQAHHFSRFAPEDQTYSLQRYINEARRLMQVLENRLSEVDYLAEEYGIADIACYPQAQRTKLLGFELDAFPAVQRWSDRIKARPAVQRARDAIMGEERPYYTAPRANLTAEEWSNLFGDRFQNASKAAE